MNKSIKVKRKIIKPIQSVICRYDKNMGDSKQIMAL